jgi:hypothetical protein
MPGARSDGDIVEAVKSVEKMRPEYFTSARHCSPPLPREQGHQCSDNARHASLQDFCAYSWALSGRKRSEPLQPQADKHVVLTRAALPSVRQASVMSGY